MKGLSKTVYWIVSVLVVLFLVGLGIKIAKALIGIAVLVGLGAVLYAIFGKPAKSQPPGSGS